MGESRAASLSVTGMSVRAADVDAVGALAVEIAEVIALLRNDRPQNGTLARASTLTFLKTRRCTASQLGWTAQAEKPTLEFRYSNCVGCMPMLLLKSF